MTLGIEGLGKQRQPWCPSSGLIRRLRRFQAYSRAPASRTSRAAASPSARVTGCQTLS